MRICQIQGTAAKKFKMRMARLLNDEPILGISKNIGAK